MMRKRDMVLGVVVLCVLPSSGGRRQSRVSVELFPTTSRMIVDQAELDRNKYFGLCDHGRDFRSRCRDDQRYDYLVKQGITFGRLLGPVNGVVQWAKAVREDPDRPGFVDLEYLKTKLSEERKEPDPVMVEHFNRLDIAAHGSHNAFPKFMGTYTTGQSASDNKPEALPENMDAAAELSAYVFKYHYNAFDRPTYYEPVNEPHWSFRMDGHLAEWHLKTLDKMHEVVPGVKVGGPCSAVGYYYRKEYDAFRGFADFIEATGCRMDFYSFHIYDFLRERKGDFAGRITTGLPTESVLDLIQNHTMNAYGKEVGLVFSEHGGYETDNPFTFKLGKRLSGSGFEKEMKIRSISDFNMVSSSIANTLTFMNHPHVVLKAVPFILLDSMAWNPRYYATLYAPKNYQDKKTWVPSRLIDFYKLFRGVEGRYVKVVCPDPDIQALAFVQDSKMFVLLNNLSTLPAPLGLSARKAPFMAIRRYGRNADFTPYFKEERLKSLGTLTIKGRESLVLMLDYKVEIPEKQVIIERPCYGNKTAESSYGNLSFKVAVPQDQPLDHAVLRVGVSRDADYGHEVEIRLNGELLEVPLEDCADRLTDDDDYASIKLIYLKPDLLQEENTVTVSFPDGQPGSVGSVIIRSAYLK